GRRRSSDQIRIKVAGFGPATQRRLRSTRHAPWEGAVRQLRFIHAVIVVFVAAFASQTFGQVWPEAKPAGGTQSICTACPVPEKDKPTWPYNDPIQAFSGRYLDSL